MKITNVRAVQPIAENSPDDWRTSIGQILVAIDTDVGLTGYGVGGGGAAGIHVVKTVLRDLLLQRDPADVESLWDEMYRATLAFGRKGIAIMAISGVDLALWDLRGKAAEQPLTEWLGGTIRSLPTYSTCWHTIDDKQLGQHTAWKLHVESHTGTDPLAAVASAVENARNAIGDSVPLMIDAWMRWDVDFTLQVANAIAEFDVDWIEEPISPDDLSGYEKLVNASPIPIAGGEHEFTAAAFQDLIDRRLHDVLQPDVCWCGGLTELVKIYKAAKAACLRVCPHRGAEIWALPAIAALDPQPLAESGRPWMTWVGGQPDIKQGQIVPPNRPGFGVIIDESAF